MLFKDFLIIVLFFKIINGNTKNRIFFPAINRLAKNFKPLKPIPHTIQTHYSVIAT